MYQIKRYSVIQMLHTNTNLEDCCEIQTIDWVGVVLEPHHDTSEVFKEELPAPRKALINAGWEKIMRKIKSA